jgi:hypothetical protein
MPVFPVEAQPSTALSFATPAFAPTAYITTAEYRAAPTAVDLKSLVKDGTGASEDAELFNVIVRASSWIDMHCDQILSATVNVEVSEARIGRNGRVFVHPDNWPVLEVRDFQMGYSPSAMAAIADLSNIWVQRQSFWVQPSGLAAVASGLQFSTAASGSQAYIRYTYVNGWPNTVLVDDAAAGNVQITVADTTGIYGGPPQAASASNLPPATGLTIYDGADTERVTVAAIDATTNTLSLNAPLAYAHRADVSVSALPASVKEAAILMTSHLIRTRGDRALEMPTMAGAPRQNRGAAKAGSSDLDFVAQLLSSFKRIR